MSVFTKTTDPLRTPANSETAISSPLGVSTFWAGLGFSTIKPFDVVLPKVSKIKLRALESNVTRKDMVKGRVKFLLLMEDVKGGHPSLAGNLRLPGIISIGSVYAPD